MINYINNSYRVTAARHRIKGCERGQLRWNHDCKPPPGIKKIPNKNGQWLKREGRRQYVTLKFPFLQSTYQEMVLLMAYFYPSVPQKVMLIAHCSGLQFFCCKGNVKSFATNGNSKILY